jgi:hypothetical protein
MVSVLASSAVDRLLEPRLGQTKDYNIDARFVLDQHAELDFYSSSSLKQSVGRHVAPHGYIILILSQTVFALAP